MLSQAHVTIGSVPEDRPHADAPVMGLHAVAGLAPPGLKVVESREERPGERAFARTDEETLVAGTLAGKRWAQQEVWYRFAPMVHGLLRRSLSPRHDHDDLVQEVFLRVFRRLHTLEKPSALRSFVYSVAVRVVSEEIRRFQVLQRARARDAAVLGRRRTDDRRLSLSRCGVRSRCSIRRARPAMPARWRWMTATRWRRARLQHWTNTPPAPRLRQTR